MGRFTSPLFLPVLFQFLCSAASSIPSITLSIQHPLTLEYVQFLARGVFGIKVHDKAVLLLDNGLTNFNTTAFAHVGGR